MKARSLEGLIDAQFGGAQENTVQLQLLFDERRVRDVVKVHSYSMETKHVVCDIAQKTTAKRVKLKVKVKVKVLIMALWQLTGICEVLFAKRRTAL